MEVLKWIQSWYQSNCDGSWEHIYGVKIDTIDNPGWCVQIDLTDTSIEDKVFHIVQYEKDENDWIICIKKDGIYKGSGDSNKLEEILRIFKNWVEGT